MHHVAINKITPVLLSKNSRPDQANTYFIYVIQKGTADVLLDDEAIEFSGNTLLFVSPFQRQFFSRIKHIHGYCISFDEEFVFFHTEHKDVLYRLPFFGYDLKQRKYVLKPDLFSQLNRIADNMFVDAKIKSPYREKILLSYINIFLLKCKQLPHSKGERMDKSHYTSLQIVHQFKNLIRQHYHHQHSVAFYAAHLRQTNNYLNIVVKEVTGKTAGKLIQDQIILSAKRLLIHSKLSSKEIAFELGFKDHSYFTKIFKKHTGVNPLAWFNLHK